MDSSFFTEVGVYVKVIRSFFITPPTESECLFHSPEPTAVEKVFIRLNTMDAERAAQEAGETGGIHWPEQTVGPAAAARDSSLPLYNASGKKVIQGGVRDRDMLNVAMHDRGLKAH